MDELGTVTIHTDGGSRGNPGPAAYGYVILNGDTTVTEKGAYLGESTNNVAEYTALVRALEHAQQLGARNVVIRSDSELMIKQMNGQYKVKNAGLRPLYEEAKAASAGFDSVQFQFVPRDQNRRADRLCNLALDQAAKSSATPVKKIKALADPRIDGVRSEAVACLQAVANTWARGNPNDPSAEAVWDQLWTILEESGVLRSSATK